MKWILREDEITTPCSSVDSYCVNGDLFRRFISCKDPMDDVILNGEEPNLQHEHLLYYNDPLHPRTARRGKFLSSKTTMKYIALIETERKLLLNKLCSANAKEKCCDEYRKCIITNCKNHPKSYQRELKEKLDSFDLMVKLYYSLDRTLDDCFPQNVVGDDESFAVARSFVTSFRKFILKLMKLVTSEAKIGIGLDCFEINDLIPWQSSNYKIEEHMIEPKVNGKILCKPFVFILATILRSPHLWCITFFQ